MIGLIGTWRLVRVEAFDANGNPQPGPHDDAPIDRVMFNALSPKETAHG